MPESSNYLDVAFTIDGVTQAQAGGIRLAATPPNSGAVTISVPDTAWHRLTVVCPAVIQSPRVLSMKLTSKTGTQQSETFNSDSRFDYFFPIATTPLSLNSIVQFAFKGNVDFSLSLVSGDPSTAVISAMFIDDFPAQ